MLKTKIQGIFLVLEIARFDGSEPPTFLNSVMPNSGLGFEVFEEPSKSQKGNREELESSQVDTRKPSKTAQPAFYIAFHLIQKRGNRYLEIAHDQQIVVLSLVKLRPPLGSPEDTGSNPSHRVPFPATSPSPDTGCDPLIC